MFFQLPETVRASLVADMDREALGRFVRRLDEDRRERTEFLLGFSPESAAGLMHLDYVTVGVDLREHVRGTPTVGCDTPDEDIADVFRATPESSVAVLDEDGGIMGVIYAEDLLHVIEEEAGETLYEFTGVQEEESVLDGPLSKVRYRYKSLIIDLGTAFLAAGAVGFFEDTIAAFTLLAVCMPVVAGMGGNAGTRSMAVTVRGARAGADLPVDREPRHRQRGDRRAVNGAITGVLVAVIASVFNRSPLLGLALGVPMVLNRIVAGVFGSIIPLVLDRIGKDPATSATIFITTATDVLGFFVSLGLAQAVL